MPTLDPIAKDELLRAAQEAKDAYQHGKSEAEVIAWLTEHFPITEEQSKAIAQSTRPLGQSTVRPLYEIAREIRKDWPKPYFGAVPYLDAMSTLNRITDDYYCDSGVSIVLYFLANANTWRGDVARRIKAELKSMAKVRK